MKTLIKLLTSVFCFLPASMIGQTPSLPTSEGNTFDNHFFDYLNSNEKEEIGEIRYSKILPKDSIPNQIIQHCLKLNKQRQCYDCILLSVNYNSDGNVCYELDFCFKKQIDDLQLNEKFDTYGYYRYNQWDVFVSGNAAKTSFKKCRPHRKQILFYKKRHPLFESLYCPQFNPEYVKRGGKVIAEYGQIFNGNSDNGFLDDVLTIIIEKLDLNPENVYFEKSGLFDFSHCPFFQQIEGKYRSELQYSQESDLIQVEHFDCDLSKRTLPENETLLYATPDLGKHIGILVQRLDKQEFIILEKTEKGFEIVQSVEL